MKSIKSLKSEFRQISHDNLPYHWLESVLLFILNKNKSFLITDEDYVLSDEEWQRFSDGLNKLHLGIPPAYIMGKQGFFGHEFVVNEHTLIPRADTEILVEMVLAFTNERQLDGGKILDLGTGSGCIAISLAKALPHFNVTAVDYSTQALEVAKQNANLLGVNNCCFVHSNWYDDIFDKFDVIVSNPPYIAKNDEHLIHLSAEPMTALVADNDGLSDIECIINGGKHHLNHQGLLAIEHGHLQGGAVQTIFIKAGFTQVKTIKDYGGNDRATLGVFLGI